MHRAEMGGVSLVALVCLLAAGLSWSCQTGPEPPHDEGGEDRREPFPILDQEPLPEGDVRRLQNCAEYPFDPPRRGPWESIESKELADTTEPTHRSVDRIAVVGNRVRVDATLNYGDDALSGEWVRLYLGNCDGWSQQAVRRTGQDGRVEFRLQDRLSKGVYGVVFQVVGDRSTARAQLWVVSSQTEVVGLDIEGGAFETGGASTSPEALRKVPDAVELARRHARRGRLVAYVHRSPASGDGTSTDRWRTRLRAAGFPVGPVVFLEEPAAVGSAGDSNRNGARNRGISGESSGRAPVVEPEFSVLYTRTPQRADQLRRAGIEYRKRVHCTGGGDGGDCGGWESALEELEPR